MSISRKNILLAWAIVTFAMTLMVGREILFKSNIPTQQVSIRNPASTMSKARSFVEASIDTPKAVSQNRFILTGRVRAKRNLAELNISWILPDSIKLVAGSMKESRLDAQNGDEIEFQVEIESNTSADLKKIILNASTIINGTQFGNAAMIANTGGLSAASAKNNLSIEDLKRKRLIRE